MSTNADIGAEIARFDRALPIERALMPPSSWYTSEAIACLERRAVFGKRYVAVTRAGAASSPGDVVAGCVAGEPWLISVGDDGVRRAFHNTCRHKGNLLASGQKSGATSIRCGYHGWQYSLLGALVRAPGVAGIEDFDRHALGLVPLALEELGPWLLINHDVEAPSHTARLAPLLAELDASGWQTDMVYAGSRSWELACNWKVYVDNYLDGGYHVSHIHPGLDAELDSAGYRTETGPSYSLQRAPASKDGRRIGSEALYAFVYPNMMINRYGRCLEGNFVTPLGANRCRVDYDFFFSSDSSPVDIEDSIRKSEQIQAEDIGVCEAVQIGLASSGFDRGRYAPRVELGEHHFHCELADDLADDLAAAPSA